MARKKTNNQRTMTQKKKSPRPTAFGTALRGLGGIGGSALGNLIGQANAGSTIGRSLGATLSRWLGAGDYTVTSNSLVQRTLNGTDAIPMMHKEGQSIIVRHKEYLGEVRGSTAFTVQQAYPLNPGSNYTFPWLSGIAAQFQEYQIKGLVYHYVPTSGNAVSSTNPALGSVMLQTSYRASDTDPANKAEMLNEYWSTESVASESCVHPIECAPTENPFKTQYIRTGLVPAGDNILFYDLGRTVVATSGQAANNNVIGDLWITYEIELRKPVVYSATNSIIQSTRFQCLSPSTTVLFTTTTPTQVGNFAAGFSGRTITFPKGAVGRYLITCLIEAQTSFTESQWTTPGVLVNCTQPFLDNNQTKVFASSATNAAGSAQLNVTYTTSVSISDPQLVATYTFPAVAALAGTPANCLCIVTETSLP